jgi:hypothetical protein
VRIVTRYKDAVTGEQAAAYLSSQGVPAKAWRHNDVFDPTTCITIDNDALISQAGALIVEFEKQHPQYEVDLDSQTKPDLSRLSSALAPPCPSCGGRLPLDADLTSCQACGEAVSVWDLIVDAHGPDVLRYCYPSDLLPDKPISPEMIREMHIPCPSCKYDLQGLTMSGLCPECGGYYDKRLVLGL